MRNNQKQLCAKLVFYAKGAVKSCFPSKRKAPMTKEQREKEELKELGFDILIAALYILS